MVTVPPRTQIVPGLATPFFPGRPTQGIALRTPSQASAQLSADLDAGYIVQPKLNGDRSCLSVVAGGQVLIQNRHGGWTSQRVANASAFVALGAGTCLDGEIWKGNFYPFEALAMSGVSLLAATTLERVNCARAACLTTGTPFLFSTPTPAYVRKLRANLPTWEGYVRKQNGAYPLGHSETSATTSWWKLKW